MKPYAYQPELDILREAQQAAAEATHQHLLSNPEQWYPCGFAWVKIRPARGRFVQACKDQGVGSVDTYEGGYIIYNPSENSTQWMEAKEMGAAAFAQVLRRHYPDMNISVHTRMD